MIVSGRREVAEGPLYEAGLKQQRASMHVNLNVYLPSPGAATRRSNRPMCCCRSGAEGREPDLAALPCAAKRTRRHQPRRKHTHAIRLTAPLGKLRNLRRRGSPSSPSELWPSESPRRPWERPAAL